MKGFMKKLILTAVLLFAFWSPVIAAETPDVCGNTYSFTYDTTTYLIKFTSSNPSLPCTSGTATLMWNGQKLNYPFAVHNSYFANITGLGIAVADGAKLYLLDSTSIVFDIF